MFRDRLGNTKNLFGLQFAIYSFLFLIPLINTLPEIWQDSKGYLFFNPIRPPLYPLFIWLFHGFGDMQLKLVTWAQSLINYSVFCYAHYWLRARLKINLIITTILMSICIYTHFIHFNIAINILSEGLSFPLALLALFFITDSFVELNKKTVLKASLASCLLILTRGQYIYFYFYLFLLILYHAKNNRLNPLFLPCTLIIVSAITSSLLIDKIYHSPKEYSIKGFTANGVTILPQAIFLASQSDEKYFSDEKTRNIVHSMILSLQNNHLNADSLPYPLSSPLPLKFLNAYFDINYNSILAYAHQAIPDTISLEDSSKISLAISKTLYQHNIKKNVSFILSRLSENFGGIWILLGITLILLCALLEFLRNNLGKPNIDQVFVLLGLSLVLTDNLVVTVFSHYELRYFYFPYFIYLCFFGMLTNRLFYHQMLSPKFKEEYD